MIIFKRVALVGSAVLSRRIYLCMYSLTLFKLFKFPYIIPYSIIRVTSVQYPTISHFTISLTKFFNYFFPQSLWHHDRQTRLRLILDTFDKHRELKDTCYHTGTPANYVLKYYFSYRAGRRRNIRNIIKKCHGMPELNKMDLNYIFA